MFNKGKMILKPVFYFVAAILLSVGIYSFIKYVPIRYEVSSQQQQIVGGQGGAETDGPLKKAIDKKSTVLCEVESFWSKYDIWGDTDAVYAPTDSDEAVTPKMAESVSCNE